tara:strand:- start:489 stop:794 length:306 start_codon:yes stop_codon:yes gene_type:complete
MNKQDIAFAKGLHKKMIIDKPKAIARYTKASLKNPNLDQETPGEFLYVKGFMAGKPKQNLKKEHVFDTKGDQKPIQKKKISKADRLKTPFVMFNDKKYHSL